MAIAEAKMDVEAMTGDQLHEELIKEAAQRVAIASIVQERASRSHQDSRKDSRQGSIAGFSNQTFPNRQHY